MREGVNEALVGGGCRGERVRLGGVCVCVEGGGRREQEALRHRIRCLGSSTRRGTHVLGQAPQLQTPPTAAAHTPAFNLPSRLYCSTMSGGCAAPYATWLAAAVP